MERRRYSWARPIVASKNDMDIIIAFLNYFVIYSVYLLEWMDAECGYLLSCGNSIRNRRGVGVVGVVCEGNVVARDGDFGFLEISRAGR